MLYPAPMDIVEGTDDIRPLLEAASPAVLTTYRADGSAHVSPVWFRVSGDAFEVVIAAGDRKLANLERIAVRAPRLRDDATLPGCRVSGGGCAGHRRRRGGSPRHRVPLPRR